MGKKYVFVFQCMCVQGVYTNVLKNTHLAIYLDSLQNVKNWKKKLKLRKQNAFDRIKFVTT